MFLKDYSFQTWVFFGISSRVFWGIRTKFSCSLQKLFFSWMEKYCFIILQFGGEYLSEVALKIGRIWNIFFVSQNKFHFSKQSWCSCRGMKGIQRFSVFVSNILEFPWNASKLSSRSKTFKSFESRKMPKSFWLKSKLFGLPVAVVPSEKETINFTTESCRKLLEWNKECL
jgi:hypothetical protein